MVGRRYPPAAQEVTEKDAAAYVEATGDDPRHSIDRGFAPPLFAVRLIAPLWRAAYQDPDLRTADQLVLHAEQRMLFGGDLPLGQRVLAQGWIKGMVSFGFGDAVLVRTVVTTEDGRMLVSMESALAVPDSTGRPVDSRRVRGLAKGRAVSATTRRLDAATPQRYADAADDHNPLHLDDEIARSAGHPRRVVHGMCTLATGVAAVGTPLMDDGRRLGYLRARFSRPVLPESEVSYSAFATTSAATYVLSARCEGRPVLRNSWFRLVSR